ncbi:MAG: hypothetical protein COV08_02095 [Candidatus Vogelbacteria bacterium CG10_big_fil_rev_8_21_14_0_10_49_38]|uniref:PDZ domain-containing protein n=1 Tax=Candidatus Vogelbacteria bacterium CG10_big_fil_rev_8_21_14_0_10_49_38 TaxID=1975043 RepID=A0A2H0RHE2_9BACT|nr:MAG: hypothetical protein BK006_02115 [bacterium CG10_49_38]PIR45982.1 MAG: hypothetical protein COV08_02095 [Candidatus Vogelbacteria bacterium CG10_big_fil_rev_8_21_14_0_10_49_38]
MTLFLFFVILAVLILAHELGHFLAAKWGGIRVDEFGLGLPPRIFGFKRGETLYSLNWLPFGGFVKIFGEDITEEAAIGSERERSLINKPKWLQAVVLSAGVFFNLVLAWILISFNLVAGLPVATTGLPAGLRLEDQALVVSVVLPESPAARAGLIPGDKLISLTAGQNSVEDLSAERVSDFVKSRSGQKIAVTYERTVKETGAGIFTATVVPEVKDDNKEALIGIAMGEVGLAKATWWQAPFYGLYFSGRLIGDTLAGFKFFFSMLITDSRGALSAVSGPIGIYGLVGDASQLGLVYLLNFVALISINLAVLNLLPFPALDGGRLLFVLIEAVTRRAIKPIVANAFNLIGFVLLILLMFVIAASDILKLL